jgi:nucleoside-diphosphate-sugar epimerase
MLRQPYWVCSSATAQTDLGWKPEVSWKDGTERSVKWYRDNGWL